MKQIKFRAWDTFHEKWVSKWIILDCNGHPFVTDISRYLPNDLNDIKIMFFTGLHDKNGKEIYKDDIVKWAGTNWLIIWEKDRFCAYKKGECLMDWWDEFEVVGNSWENPELKE